jgi:hypothetical protein
MPPHANEFHVLNPSGGVRAKEFAPSAQAIQPIANNRNMKEL